VRIIAATNRDLKKAMAGGTFREDLYWRLNVISIQVPPLRERRDDIPQLVTNFVHRYNGQLGKEIQGFAPEAMDILFAHHWPGNVRELENVVERAMVLAKANVILPRDLPGDLALPEIHECTEGAATNLDRAERQHVSAVLATCGWNKYKAAKMMGISRSTLYSKIRKHGLTEAL
jgi:transcriptional regulator with PAS, ATPase and Fis domain